MPASPASPRTSPGCLVGVKKTDLARRGAEQRVALRDRVAHANRIDALRKARAARGCQEVSASPRLDAAVASAASAGNGACSVDDGIHRIVASATELYRTTVALINSPITSATCGTSAFEPPKTASGGGWTKSACAREAAAADRRRGLTSSPAPLCEIESASVASLVTTRPDLLELVSAVAADGARTADDRLLALKTLAAVAASVPLELAASHCADALVAGLVGYVRNPPCPVLLPGVAASCSPTKAGTAALAVPAFVLQVVSERAVRKLTQHPDFADFLRLLGAAVADRHAVTWLCVVVSNPMFGHDVACLALPLLVAEVAMWTRSDDAAAAADAAVLLPSNPSPDRVRAIHSRRQHHHGDGVGQGVEAPVAKPAWLRAAMHAIAYAVHAGPELRDCVASALDDCFPTTSAGPAFAWRLLASDDDVVAQFAMQMYEAFPAAVHELVSAGYPVVELCSARAQQDHTTAVGAYRLLTVIPAVVARSTSPSSGPLWTRASAVLTADAPRPVRVALLRLLVALRDDGFGEFVLAVCNSMADALATLFETACCGGEAGREVPGDDAEDDDDRELILSPSSMRSGGGDEEDPFARWLGECPVEADELQLIESLLELVMVDPFE